ncbi:MAG TPA: hypothetical protein VFR56_10565, partial [Actinomycetes bacterium]|nr:hypothetical protein [Actinomycetes bacterium]
MVWWAGQGRAPLATVVGPPRVDQIRWCPSDQVAGRSHQGQGQRSPSRPIIARRWVAVKNRR